MASCEGRLVRGSLSAERERDGERFHQSSGTDNVLGPVLGPSASLYSPSEEGIHHSSHCSDEKPEAKRGSDYGIRISRMVPLWNSACELSREISLPESAFGGQDE